MECLIVNPADVALDSHEFVLRDDEARHAARSLRMRVGEVILATDLEGTCYRGMITEIAEEAKHELIVRARIDAVQESFNESSIDVELIQGIPNRPSTFEEIVERCTEIGISRFSPVMTTRVERNTLKVERLEKILRSACKQSYRARKPILAEVQTLDSALDESLQSGRSIIFLHESAPQERNLTAVLRNLASERISLVVGPEGGFTDDELDRASSRHEVAIASLGPRRLRAETAAIVAASIALLSWWE